MKTTIEERANKLIDFVLKDVDPMDCLLFAKLIKEGYITGATEEHEILTSWHDPKEELPQEGKTVLIRVNGLELYKVGYYRPNRVHEYQWHTDDLSMPDSFVLGWREIHE